MAVTQAQRDYRSVWRSLDTVAHKLAWIDVEGVSTRYIEAGRRGAPVVLLLHGTAGSLENFSANYGALAGDFHVFGIDMLGCGYTDKPGYDYFISDYAAHAIGFLDTLGIDKVAVAGVSLGSWVGARMSVDHPNRITCLAMVAPAGIVVDEVKEAEFAAGVRQRRSAAAATPSWDSVQTAMSGLVLDTKDLIDDLIAVRLAIYQQTTMKQAMPRLLAFSLGGQHLTQHEWESIDIPILSIAAVDAPNMFLDNAYAIARTAPNVQLLEMAGTDHWAQFERPDEFNSALKEFVEQAIEEKSG